MTPGADATATLTVTAADTATSLGSGDVDVLGTPRLIALCERATVRVVADELPADQTTVGTRVELDHLRSSLVGATVVAHALLVDIDGGRLRFDVEARDGETVVARGTVVRALVDRAKFATP